MEAPLEEPAELGADDGGLDGTAGGGLDCSPVGGPPPQATSMTENAAAATAHLFGVRAAMSTDGDAPSGLRR